MQTTEIVEVGGDGMSLKWGRGRGRFGWRGLAEGARRNMSYLFIIQNVNFIMLYYNIWGLWQYKVPVFDDQVS